MFNTNIKNIRQELELSQGEFGKIFDVTNNTVSGWENGHDTMPFDKMIKLCNLYDLSLDYVCGLSKKNIKLDKINISKEEIGKRLKSFRKSLNISQQSLANRCSFARQTYSNYETGKFLINTITIYTICKTYNISMDYLLGRTDDPKIK